MLLDTRSLLWTLNGGEEFGSHARALLARATDPQYSSISIAEIRIKQLLGKLTVPDDLLLRIEEAGLRPAAYSAEAADDLLNWPQLVRHDPFDRLLLTQAVAAGTTLLTADRTLLALAGAPVIDART